MASTTHAGPLADDETPKERTEVLGDEFEDPEEPLSEPATFKKPDESLGLTSFKTADESVENQATIRKTDNEPGKLCFSESSLPITAVSWLSGDQKDH